MTLASLKSPREPVKIVDFLPCCEANFFFSLLRASLTSGSPGRGTDFGGVGNVGATGAGGVGLEKIHILVSP